jgi:two-component system, cell cycle response regulator
VSARILVVDDVLPNLRLLEAKLRAEFYEVELAASAQDALAKAKAWAPDVILLDVMMPEMDGFEVCRRLKADPTTAHLPVVMVTALTEQPERVCGLQAGADDFLSKPVDDAALFARLRALLRVKQVQDAWRQQAAIARQLGFETRMPLDDGLRHASAVLVAADPEEAAGLSQLLRAEGMAIDVAADAEAGRAALQACTHDAALLCLGGAAEAAMLRFASRLRAEGVTRDLPVLLIGDPAQREALLRGLDIGASDHVLRPVDANELLARVRNQIRRKRYQDQLQTGIDRSLELAVTDPLTGLRNRRYFLRHLDGLLAEETAAVLIIDIDRFKQINDTAGHAAGDAALRNVAERLRHRLRAADVIARFGGEEFIVALRAAAPDYALLVAERLRAGMAAEPISIGAQMLPLTISVGLALAPAGASAEQAIAAADAALYRAKGGGRNRVELARLEDFARRPGEATI